MNNVPSCENCIHKHYSGPCHPHETPYCKVDQNHGVVEYQRIHVHIDYVCDKYESNEITNKDLKFKKENNYRKADD